MDVNVIELVKSFSPNSYLQKSASIQPRTSPAKFGSQISQITYFSMQITCLACTIQLLKTTAVEDSPLRILP